MKKYSSSQLQDKNLSDKTRNMIYCGIDTVNTLNLFNILKKKNKNEYSYERNKKLILTLFNKKQPMPSLDIINNEIKKLCQLKEEKIDQLKYVYSEFVTDTRTFNINSNLQKRKLFQTLKFKERNKGSWGIDTLEWYYNFGKEEQKNLVSLFIEIFYINKKINNLKVIKTENFSITHDIKDFKLFTRSCGLISENIQITDYREYYKLLGYNCINDNYENNFILEKILNVKFETNNDEEKSVLNEWLVGEGPLITSKKLGIIPKEIKLYFKKFNEKYKNFIEFKDLLKQELFETNQIVHPITNTSYDIYDRVDTDIAIRKALSFLTNEMYLDILSKRNLENTYLIQHRQEIGI